jgi:hypothetical protein
MKCCVEGCNNQAGVPGSARGLCRAHYRRWQRYGTELEPSRRVVSWRGEKCAEVGCDNPIEAHGLCENHYKTATRRNNPEAQKKRNLAFKRRVRAKQEIKMGRPRPSHCELCGADGKGPHGHKWVGIVFDHCHKTGTPRGWLCDRCNKVLGLVKDDIALLGRMISYLAESGDTEPVSLQHGK